MGYDFKNLDELRARILLLKQDRLDHELYFEQKFVSIKNAFNSPINYIKNSFNFSSLKPNQSSFSTDYITNLAKAFLPILLNKTIFKNQGILIKTIVTLFSSKAISAKIINKDILSHWIDKLTDFIDPKSKNPNVKDYGIPEDSETY